MYMSIDAKAKARLLAFQSPQLTFVPILFG